MFLSRDELNSYKSWDDIPSGSTFYLGCDLVMMIDLSYCRTVITLLYGLQKGCESCVNCHSLGNKNLLTK